MYGGPRMHAFVPLCFFLSIQLPVPLWVQLAVQLLRVCHLFWENGCHALGKPRSIRAHMPITTIWPLFLGNSVYVCSRASFSHHGVRIGILEVDILPCKASGGVLTENDEVFVDDPEELVGQRVDYQLKIKTLKGLPSNYMSVYCKYRFQGDKEDFTTDMVRK